MSNFISYETSQLFINIVFHRSVLMAIIVEKSKKVLDFSVTLFIIHFVLCIFYNGAPSTWDW